MATHSSTLAWMHEAIGAGCQIRFKYYQWNVDKQMELRKDGAWYQVSPWALMWDDENYYLVAFDATDGKIKHYRVDKMLSISVTKEKRLGQEQFKRFDMPRYTKSLFGMYGGEQVKVMLEARNDMVGVIIDRFGKDVLIAPVDSERFRVNVDVCLSNQFLGWIMAVGDGIKIVGPDKVVEKMRTELRRLCEQYRV